MHSLGCSNPLLSPSSLCLAPLAPPHPMPISSSSLVHSSNPLHSLSQYSPLFLTPASLEMRFSSQYEISRVLDDSQPHSCSTPILPVTLAPQGISLRPPKWQDLLLSVLFQTPGGNVPFGGDSKTLPACESQNWVGNPFRMHSP